jgi:hypothetical protein
MVSQVVYLKHVIFTLLMLRMPLIIMLVALLIVGVSIASQRYATPCLCSYSSST